MDPIPVVPPPKLPGAKCQNCPLASCVVVPPTRAQGPAQLVIIGEAPGKSEASEGRPFIGPSGFMVDRELQANHIDRTSAHITNAVACYPARDLKKKEWSKAIAACHPRLMQELAELEDVPRVSLGGKALASLTGRDLPVTKWFGAPLEGHKLFPMIHPAAVMRNQLWKGVFKSSWARAKMWIDAGASDDALWSWPELIIEEGPEAWAAIERIAKAPVIGVDVENAGDPIHAALLCVGVSDDVGAVSLEWPMSLPFQELMASIIAGKARKIFHNAHHDMLCLEANGMPVFAPIGDTLLLHVAKYPGLPHSLDFACAQAFPAPRWKSEFKDSGLKGIEAFTKADPVARRTYNAKDAYMGLRLWTHLNG